MKKELLSQVNRTDLANINDRQMEEQLSDPATVQQLLDFLALVQGKRATLTAAVMRGIFPKN